MRRWILAAVALPLAAACGRPDRPAATMEPAAAASASAVAARPDAGDEVVYVDVRTPAEYAAGHVQGALNIPYDQMAGRADELDAYRGRHIVLYCRTGHRAGIAYDVLKSKGFTDIENGGGLDALIHAGIPAVTP